ncbi:MAG: DUF3332 domain-containing protein [Prevotellaceae bacterium]|jgi:hypothetical protein|nr:DUF3332 domain-containing protein [Prevotellaceae bacterium]
MKKIKVLTAVVFTAFIMSSCIGSFKLSRSLYEWNTGIGSKFANEVVFIAVSPAYAVCILGDIFIVNSVEFWNDEEVFSMKNSDVKEIEYNGVFYTVTKKRNTLRIEQTDNAAVYAELSYDRIKKSWRVKNDNYNQEIMRFLDDNKIEVYLPNNKKQTFEMNEKGIAELREIVNN